MAPGLDRVAYKRATFEIQVHRGPTPCPVATELLQLLPRHARRRLVLDPDLRLPLPVASDQNLLGEGSSQRRRCSDCPVEQQSKTQLRLRVVAKVAAETHSAAAVGQDANVRISEAQVPARHTETVISGKREAVHLVPQPWLEKRFPTSSPPVEVKE
jgi:hypothetical protein